MTNAKQTIVATDETIHDIVSTALLDGLHDFLEHGTVLDLNHVDVSKVTRMVGLFRDAVCKFDISSWDVSNVEDMREVFRNCAHTFDVSNWDVSNVLDFDFLFFGSLFDGDISSWNLNPHCDTYASLNRYQLINGHPSELAYMERCMPATHHGLSGEDLEAPGYIESKLRMGCYVGTFSEKEEVEFMHYATTARMIHAGLGSNLFGRELGRFAWELRQRDGQQVDVLELPADIFEMDE